MPARFWNSLRELQENFERVGGTHQQRLNNLVASMRTVEPPAQRQNLHTLSDVADSTAHLRNLLFAIMPPDVTEQRGG